MVPVVKIAHRLAGLTFVAALVVALVGGLVWALNPDTSSGFRITGGGAATPEEPEPTPTPDGEATSPTPTPTPTPTPSPTPEEDEDAEELIAEARDPAETSVQVLEAGGGMEATTAAAETLGGLGYNVINVTSSRTGVSETTVWYTDGNETEARALRARDSRVAHVEPNERLHENIDLHVLVGPDWEG